MKHSNWGDAVPHAPKSSVAKLRGIRRLAPAHKKNKITISNNQVSGLAGLSRVEYEDVVQLMSSLGVAIPDRPGKDWKREIQIEKRKEIKTRGWNSSEGWGIGDQIYGYDASAERKQNVDRIVAEAGGVNSLIKKKWKGLASDAEWTIEGGWKPKEQKREELDEAELEWEPTALEGEMEIDPNAYQSKYPLRNLGPEEDNNAEPITPSYSSNPPTLPPSVARSFSIEDLDSLPDVSFSAPSRINLSGLGPGWLEDAEAGDYPPSKEQRTSALDRLKTFKRLGIEVPDLVSQVSVFPPFFDAPLTSLLASLSLCRADLERRRTTGLFSKLGTERPTLLPRRLSGRTFEDSPRGSRRGALGFVFLVLHRFVCFLICSLFLFFLFARLML